MTNVALLALVATGTVAGLVSARMFGDGKKSPKK
jgi:hypothetical protein